MKTNKIIKTLCIFFLLMSFFIPSAKAATIDAPKAIEQEAIRQAWPLGTPKYKYKAKTGSPTKAYLDSMNTNIKYSAKKKKEHRYARGVACSVFVCSVIRATGYDKKWPTSVEGAYKRATSSSKWRKISREDAKAGDIFIRNDKGHIMIYGGKSNGKHIWYQAHAKAQGGTYGYAEYGKSPKSKKKFKVWRATGSAEGSIVTSEGTIDGANAIIQACTELAWPLGTSKSKWKKPTSALKKYVDKQWPNRKWGRKYGASCDKAVFIAVRKSGYDKKFKKNLEDQINPDNWDRNKWQLVQGGKSASLDRSKFQTGDIIVTDRPGTGGHIYIIYKQKSAGQKQIVCEGSYSNAYHLHLAKSKDELHQKPGNLGNWHWRPTGKIKGNVPNDNEDLLKEVKVGKAYNKCNQILSDKVVSILKYIFLIIQVATPILLIILTMVDFAKAVVGNDKKDLNKAFSRFVKRAIIAACIFMVPTFINFLMDVTGISDGVCGIT